jgi:hypothetical protein
MPFQEIGRDFLCLRANAILADDMGLGKTFQILEAIKKLGGVVEEIDVVAADGGHAADAGRQCGKGLEVVAECVSGAFEMLHELDGLLSVSSEHFECQRCNRVWVVSDVFGALGLSGRRA